jgi:hypothetical protein
VKDDTYEVRHRPGLGFSALQRVTLIPVQPGFTCAGMAGTEHKVSDQIGGFDQRPPSAEGSDQLLVVQQLSAQ